jgi:hypothetical protein
MTRSLGGTHAFPVEDFVQALSAQLDRAQDALALKARTGRPLTFALKDLSVDLKVFWESRADGRLLLRHAAPGENGASTVQFSFTTITRSMVEENTFALAMEDDPRGLDELPGGVVLPAEDKRKLEMAGVRTVGQLRRMSDGTDAKHVGAVLDIPVNNLHRLLQQSARPAVSSSENVRAGGGRRLLRIRGANLMNGEAPRVLMAGEAVEVLEAKPTELLVRPMSHHREGSLEVVVGEESTTTFFEIAGDAPDPYAQPSKEAAP